MPITPFHFGPGVFLKGMSPKYFDLRVFFVSQIVMDTETAWNIVKGNERLHTTFHTYLGSLGVVAITLALLFTYRKLMMKFWPNGFRKTDLNASILRSSFIIPFSSALIGAWSHVFLDSIMHADMRPFNPLSDVNPMLESLSLQTLHLGCLISGAVGGIVWALTAFRR